MNILQPKTLKQRASALLAQSPGDYGKTVLLYSAILYGAPLILSVLDLLFNSVISGTGGLSGIGSRAALSTLQSLLNMLVSLVLPFWQIGILYTSIRLTRQQDVYTPMLKRGFDRFGPVLRYYLLMTAIAFGVCMVSAYASVPFAMNTPIPPALQEFLLTADESVLHEISDQQLQALFLSVLLPALLVFSLIMLYLSYRLRLCQYLLLDDPQAGALEAMSMSSQLTKGHKWRLLLLDISFWWYYLLQGVLAVLPLIPSFLGKLPLPDTVLYLLLQLISCLGSIALFKWKGAYVELTFACAYDQLRTPPQQITVVE